MKRYDVAPGGDTQDMIQTADGVWVLFEDVERIAAIVAKMRADLTEIGGFDNRLVGQPAVNVREYIAELEAALGTGPNVRSNRETTA